MNYPELLKPALAHRIELPSRGMVEVPKTTPIFRKWTGEMPSDTFNRKPVLEFDGEMVFAELAILRIFQKAGWEGRWIDSYRHRYLTSYWPIVTSDLPREETISDWQAIRATANCKSGCFDVFCWRDDTFLFIEAKRKAHDKTRATQHRWLQAALDRGLSLESFLIAEWDYVPAGYTQ